MPKSLERSAITISVGKRVIEALVDSGATENYMSQSLMNSLDLCLQGEQSTVTLASTDSVTKVLGSVEIAIEIQGRRYRNVKFGIVFNLCADIILGLDFLQKHRRVIFQFHGGVNDLSIGADAEHCAVSAAKINEMPEIFKFVDSNIRPVAVKSRNYSSADRHFIANEVSKLLKDGIIERSVSP